MLHAFHVIAFLVVVVGEYTGEYKVIPWLHLDHDELAFYQPMKRPPQRGVTQDRHTGVTV